MGCLDSYNTMFNPPFSNSGYSRTKSRILVIFQSFDVIKLLILLFDKRLSNLNQRRNFVFFYIKLLKIPLILVHLIFLYYLYDADDECTSTLIHTRTEITVKTLQTLKYKFEAGFLTTFVCHTLRCCTIYNSDFINQGNGHHMSAFQLKCTFLSNFVYNI